MRKPAGPVVAGLVAIVTLAGCGGGSEKIGGGSSDRTPATEQTTSSGASAYVGLTKEAAIARAEASDVAWRITREDDEEFLVTQDYDPERLNFEIDDGKVTKATYG